MSLRSSVSTWINELRYSSAKRGLESDLSKIVSIAEGHKSADLPAGHEYYKALEHKADLAINTFMDKAQSLGHRTDIHEIKAGAPALRTLDQLANGTETGSTASKVAIGSLFGGFLVTLLFAVYHDFYLFLTHWANVKWGH